MEFAQVFGIRLGSDDVSIAAGEIDVIFEKISAFQNVFLKAPTRIAHRRSCGKQDGPFFRNTINRASWKGDYTHNTSCYYSTLLSAS